MQVEILVEIPDDETDLVDYFQNQLDSDFRDALDFDVIAQGDRVVLDEVKITTVALTNFEIEVEYELEFSAYLGCRDANWADTESSSVAGIKRDETWVFERHIPWEPRSTLDEF
jgi:hypothetical protein